MVIFVYFEMVWAPRIAYETTIVTDMVLFCRPHSDEGKEFSVCIVTGRGMLYN